MSIYHISDEALNDLEKIWIYTFRKWSQKQADRYYATIISEIEFLNENHLVGKSVEHVRTGYRVSFVKSHAVFYKITPDNNLAIIRILHQSVDVEKWIE